MRLLVSIALASAIGLAADYRVGVGRIDITPKEPIWMSGYANRTKPSQGVAQKLWAKALAIDDGKGGRAVLVTTDLIGLPKAMSDTIAARVLKQYDLERSRLFLNSSHTHTGPVVRSNLQIMYDFDAHNRRVVDAYGQFLTDSIVTAVGEAISKLSPASLSFGEGSVGFAMNRRESTPKGVRIGTNPKGPVDHSVPVLRVSRHDGTLVAVLFGYACHNTTLTGEHYEITGDYSGYAQAAIEKTHPESTAMFLMLCGADANPSPRSKVDHAQAHGTALASEVTRVLSGQLDPVKGKVRTAFRTVDLPLGPHTRETFEPMLTDRNIYRVRLARQMLQAYDERRAPRTVPYPAQAVRLGDKLAIVGLGGEVVVDYALGLKRRYPKMKLIVAGYTNDVMAYIPTAAILREGGYEAVDSMVYYGQPVPFTAEVEGKVYEAAESVMKRVGLKAGKVDAGPR